MCVSSCVSVRVSLCAHVHVSRVTCVCVCQVRTASGVGGPGAGRPMGVGAGAPPALLTPLTPGTPYPTPGELALALKEAEAKAGSQGACAVGARSVCAGVRMCALCVVRGGCDRPFSHLPASACPLPRTPRGLIHTNAFPYVMVCGSHTVAVAVSVHGTEPPPNPTPRLHTHDPSRSSGHRDWRGPSCWRGQRCGGRLGPCGVPDERGGEGTVAQSAVQPPSVASAFLHCT